LRESARLARYLKIWRRGREDEEGGDECTCPEEYLYDIELLHSEIAEVREFQGLVFIGSGRRAIGTTRRI
jgi:hypothetical protein